MADPSDSDLGSSRKPQELFFSPNPTTLASAQPNLQSKMEYLGAIPNFQEFNGQFNSPMPATSIYADVSKKVNINQKSTSPK